MRRYLFLIITLIAVIDTYGIIRYVKPTATGTGDGSTWANASADLQAMIVASSSGDEVWVAAGVYKPLKDGSGNASPANVQNKIFWLKSGVKLYGSFAGTETLISQRVIATNKTILSGDIDNNDTNTDGNNIAELQSHIQGTNVYQVLALVGCDKTTVVDGFVMTAAVGSSTTGAPPGQTINGSTVFPYFGSAMHMSGGSYPTIRNCVFSGNGGTYGAIYHNNSTYTDTVKVFNSVFTGNSCQITGGMFMHRGHSYLNNVVMFNNSATSNGAAFVVSNNMANSGQIVVVNSTFVNNYGSTSGKSIGITGGTTKLHNVIVFNTSPYSGGSVLINSPGTISSTNSLLQNSKNAGVWNNGYGTDGGGNIDLNPNFLNVASPAGVDGSYFTSDDGLTLTNCSPAINTGTSSIPASASILTTDILGNPRPFSSGAVDIGAYEFQSASVVPPDPTAVSVSNTSITCGQSVTLSATCAVGTVTWYTALGGGTSVGTGNGLSVSPTVNPITYYAACQTSATCVSINRIATGSITVSLPSDPTNVTVSNTTICPNTQVSLSASCAVGVPEWYNGASALSTANPFMPTVTTTTTYSVKCKSGICYSNSVNATQILVLGNPNNVTSSVRNFCGNTIPAITFTATCTVGTPRWYTSSNGGTAIGTGSPFTTTPVNPTPGFNNYYASCSNGTCESNRSISQSFVYTPVPSNVTANPSFICSPSSVTLSASCSYGTINWYNTATGGTSLGTTNSISQTVSNTTTYYAECTNNFLSVCFTDRVAVTVTLESTPSNPTNVSTNKTFVCPNTSVSLSANCSGGTIKWYNAATGGTALGTGSPLVQNPSTTTTYYAACETVSCGNSSRVPTQVVQVATVGSNLNLTTNLSGTSVQASSNTITATNSILTGANVQYLANNSITLNPQSGGGFQVANGAVFEAKIMALTGCN